VKPSPVHVDTAAEIFSGPGCTGDRVTVDATHREKLCSGSCFDSCFKSYSSNSHVSKGLAAESGSSVDNRLVSMRVMKGFYVGLYGNKCFGTSSETNAYKKSYSRLRFIYAGSNKNSECVTFEERKRPLHMDIHCFANAGDSRCTRLGLPTATSPLEKTRSGMIQSTLTLNGMSLGDFEGIDGTKYRQALMDSIQAFAGLGEGSE